jgi:hypothetical protein
MLLAVVADDVPIGPRIDEDMVPPRSLSPPSAIAPAGMYIRCSSFGPGVADPQHEQKEADQSPSGLDQSVTRSSPRTQRNADVSTKTTAMPLLPVKQRQIEQWQT